MQEILCSLAEKRIVSCKTLADIMLVLLRVLIGIYQWIEDSHYSIADQRGENKRCQNARTS